MSIQMRLEEKRAQILEQAGDDWYEFKVDTSISETGMLRVPKAPFYRWVLRFKNDQLWPEWRNVSRVGEKMMNDDPNHTDWIIGAGLDPSIYYSLTPQEGSPAQLLEKAAYRARFDLEHELLRFEVSVLSGSGSSEGCAWHAEMHPGELPGKGHILILPNLSVKWLEHLIAAADAGMATVTEQGGATAHLVSVGREHEARIVRDPDARKKYSERWTVLRVDCDRGRIDVEGDG